MVKEHEAKKEKGKHAPLLSLRNSAKREWRWQGGKWCWRMCACQRSFLEFYPRKREVCQRKWGVHKTGNYLRCSLVQILVNPAVQPPRSQGGLAALREPENLSPGLMFHHIGESASDLMATALQSWVCITPHPRRGLMSTRSKMS